MKKKIWKYLFIAVLVILATIAIKNAYKWIRSGNQTIYINTPSKIYSNSDLYISTVAEKNGKELKTTAKVKLLDFNKKEVKDTKVSYTDENSVISIPNVKPGNYIIDAYVSTEEGDDSVQKSIYISNTSLSNYTITLDKGIYKPGDTVNYRTLVTSKIDNKPVKSDVNICIYDGNNNKVYNENMTTSNYGIISGSFTLADEVNSGIYKLVVRNGQEEETKSFKVNPYLTPKYEVKIETDKKNYIVNDTANINIKTNYFFGEPASGAKLIVYINGSEYKTLMADENGNANFKYEIKSPSTYNIKVEAVDASNYYVEQSTSFTAGSDIFEVNLFPEYGKLVNNQKNKVYVFTKSADGTPIKSYVTIRSGEIYNKQVVTDENGIGEFTIDIDYSKSKQFKISATNMQNETVNKEVNLECQNANLILSTDKVKYEQGEYIKLNIVSEKQNKKNIYFFKNNQLIKLINTDSKETAVNLGDCYGLIDIIVSDKSSYRSNTFAYKRTIFIKPKNSINIGIKTDKNEYKPGENIKVSFETTEENNNNIDAALLVSMLDNSILSLADNDLSIDNVRLALSDISFTNELDAATLYSCILDDNSEQAIAGLLLKQKDRDFRVSETRHSNYEDKEKSRTICVCSIILLIVISFAALYVKFPKFRIGVNHLANVTAYVGIIYILVAVILIEGFRHYDLGWIEFVSILVICISSYIALLSRISNRLFRTTIKLAICIFILLIFNIAVAMITYYDVSPAVLIVGIAVIVLTLSICSRIKKFKSINIKWKSIFKFVGSIALSIITAWIIGAITRIYAIQVPVILLGIYLFDYLFNRKSGQNKTKIDENTVTITVPKVILGVIVAVGVIVFIGVIGILIINNSSSIVESARPMHYETNDGIIPGTDYASSASSSSSKSILSGIDGIFSFGDSIKNTITNDSVAVREEEKSSNNNEQPTTSKQESESKIRNVFLESMCFIPELVTSEGKAELNLKLSDNITTWTIQTVGNTLDGRINYNKLDNVKVFKDFFVDFELPKNLVESDKVSIPVTIYNYTENNISTALKIKEDEWFKLNSEHDISASVNAKESKLIYIPIEILKFGEYKFRVEASSGELTDIIEKEISILPNGYKIEKVVSSGTLDGNTSEDILLLDEIIPNTAKAKIKIYASSMAQTVEGMENILRMPTGCFEQISSSLYPDILVLKYLQDNGIVNEELKEKAIKYITTGYQKLLTYEVPGEKGGYSLYGRYPAETVLTAYGLMELTDLKEVYSVDENVLKNMQDFLYKKQNLDGSFTITGNHQGGAGSRNNMALNAYITWALSESTQNNDKLQKAIDYLKNNLNNIDDNYTLALIANCLINVKDSKANDIIKRLVNNTNVNERSAYITSNITDYYGSMYDCQNLQTAALTSIALSKTSSNTNINKSLINYIISKKDTRGTWHSTQATILCLKALNAMNEKSSLDNQTIKVRLNSDEKEIDIKGNALELYEVEFNNLNKENKLSIEMKKGNAFYEVIEEHYIPYEKVDKSDKKIEVVVNANSSLNVNGTLNANVKLTNNNANDLYNGMVTISIPQGFSVIEESLAKLKHNNLIEKYEMNYSYVNLYLRNFAVGQVLSLDVSFRARYPVSITGLAVRAYDYYNPQIEGVSTPIEINVIQ